MNDTVDITVQADPPAVESVVYDHLELLSEMGQDFVSTRDLDASLGRAMQHIADYVGAEGGALFMLEDEGRTLKCHASVGPTEISGLTLPSDQGIVGRSVQDNAAEIIRDAQNDPRFYKGVDEQTGFTTLSILCAPMSVKDERIGAIELINKSTGDGLFDDHDMHLLQAMSASAALAIHNARMAEALVEQERVARELELAAEIQRSLLPDEPAAEFPVAGVNFPARTVSGDFYDFFELEDGRICFNLGDVSGKGMNAALMMAKTASLYRCLGKDIDQPGKLLARVNEEVCETAARGMFVTMVGGIYDPKTGRVRIANAGHEPPLLHGADGSFTDMPAEAPPIGISPFLVDDDGYPEEEFDLQGGALYIFTDGVTEGYTEDGSELGAEGVRGMLEDLRDAPVGTRLAAIAETITRRGEALRDDLTLLGIDGRAAFAGKDDDVDIEDDKLKADAGEDLAALQVTSNPNRLKLVRQVVAEAATMAGCDADMVRDVVIAVDEALQNVIRHGYGGSPDGAIHITLRMQDETLIILIRDWASRVDPNTVKPRDLDDIRPGGLGTHFIREVMDEVEFLPPPRDDGGDGGNVLRLLKRIGHKNPQPREGAEKGA